MPPSQIATAFAQGSEWTFTWVRPPVTQQREHDALHKVQHSPLLPGLLDPRKLQHKSRVLLDEKIQGTDCWPVELRHSRIFAEMLLRRFDPTQCEAIVVRCWWLGHARATAHNLPQLACHHLRALQDTTLPHVPFALVQGPPGTGKTHTVHGILNVWHLTHYVRYHQRMQDRITNILRQEAERPHQLPTSGDEVVMLTSDVRALRVLNALLICCISIVYFHRSSALASW